MKRRTQIPAFLGEGHRLYRERRQPGQGIPARFMRRARELIMGPVAGLRALPVAAVSAVEAAIAKGQTSGVTFCECGGVIHWCDSWSPTYLGVDGSVTSVPLSLLPSCEITRRNRLTQVRHAERELERQVAAMSPRDLAAFLPAAPATAGTTPKAGRLS